MVDRRRRTWVNKSVNVLFTRWFRFRRGKVGFRGAPSCILHTVGAKSASPRQTPLLYLDVGDGRIALVGSNGGDDRTPAWVHNLRVHPEVEVELAGGRRKMVASIADADERAVLWPRVVDMYQSYATYQRKTTREIPVIVLVPRAG